MPVTFNNLADPQAAQAQEPKANKPLDPAKGSNFASLMQTLAKDKQGSAQASSTPRPAAGSTEERIYNAVHAGAEKYNLPPALILGFIKQESGFKPNAKSWCGAMGCMQLMPGTAKQLGVTDPWNIEQNIDGGCKYIRQMLDTFGGDLKKAIAAYNSGPGNVKKYGGIPPFDETQKYVPAVLAHAEKFNNGAPITVSGSPAVASVQAQPPVQKIDYNLVIDAIHSADVMTQAAMSLAITSNVQPINMPEPSKGSDDAPPPPPPPRGMRV
ncbi:MAG TPA: lytic transglycosylase domain-containing protein [bacterium]|nr:lytic transglycosylase domain-containing protein [bacterium]